MAEPTLEDLLDRAAGFGRCPVCPYFAGGSAELCYLCSSRGTEALAPERCEICDAELTDEGCKNPVCSMSSRWFDRNYSIAVRSGVLERAMNAYKFAPPGSGNRKWSTIFGRIVAGYLDAHIAELGAVDLIIGSPTFLGPGAHREWDHIGEILAAADREQRPSHEPWPFDLVTPRAVVKTVETERLTGKSYQERRAYAESALRGALAVPDPSRTAGSWVVVFDDTFTGGLTLREVARVLRRDGGARRVTGLTLARQPFGR